MSTVKTPNKARCPICGRVIVSPSSAYLETFLKIHIAFHNVKRVR